MYIVIELCLVLILLLMIIISALQGWLDKQLPLCRTITYVGIIVLTILDLVYNNSNTKIGIGMAVIISSIFEIVSNLKLNFEIYDFSRNWNSISSAYILLFIEN